MGSSDARENPVMDWHLILRGVRKYFKLQTATKPELVLAKLDTSANTDFFLPIYLFTYGITIVSDPIPSSGISTKTLLWI